MPKSETKSHYKLAPSAASRWLVCTKEPELRSKVPNKSSVYAEEGTTAHWVAEQCLRTGKRAQFYVNQRCPETMQIVPDDMADPVQVYVDYCTSIKGEWQAVEVKFTLPNISADLGGTCDFASVTNTTLQIADLKFGKGKAVKVEMNPQLLIYALGAYYELEQKHPEIAKKLTSLRYGVVQPRLDDDEPVKLASMLITELMKWKKDVLFPAVTATEAILTDFNAGEWCFFCPAKAICPAQHEKAMALAQVDFAEVPTKAPAKPESLTPEQLAKVLEAKDDLVSWLNAVEALAQNNLEAGIDVPGFKLVEKRSNRQWADEAKAEEFLKTRLGKDAMEVPSVISIAQAEKALKFLDEAIPKDLISKPPGGRIIAPLDDKRPAVARSAIADFTEPKDDFLD